MIELYRQEEVQQILQLAIARQSQSGELTREQLVEIAADLGISLSELQTAEREWLVQREEQQEQQLFNRDRQGKFRQHLTKYAITNLFLIVLNLMGSGELTWSLYFLLAWGLGLSLDGWKAYQMHGEQYEYAFQKWRRKRQLKQTVNTILDRVLKPELLR